MKGITVSPTEGLKLNARLVCADNTGAKELELAGVKKKKSVRRRLTGAGVGDVVVVRVTKGRHELRQELHHAVIIRQKKEFSRANGMRIAFEDNAAILVTEEMTPRGSKIKGPVAKECVERFSSIGKVATMVM